MQLHNKPASHLRARFCCSTMVSIGYLEIMLATICFLIVPVLLSKKKRSLGESLPVVGMLPDLFFHFHRIHEIAALVLERSGCTFFIKGPRFCNMDILITVDPANVHYIMSANFSNFPKGPEYNKILDIMGDGIFNADSDKWSVQRRIARALIIKHRFHQFVIRTSQDKVVHGLIPFIDHVSERGQVVDLQDVFQRFAFDTTCILVTGYDPKSLSIELPDVPFSKAMDVAEEVIFLRHILPESVWKLQKWLGIGKEQQHTKAWETIDQVIGKYITMKREELKSTQDPRKVDDDHQEGVDLLASYITKDDSTMNGIICDHKFLRDTILNLMIAGRDTTSSALTWFFWLVSKNPSVETKIRNELKSIIPSADEAEKWRLFNLDEVNKLTYLQAAFCESLRLYPPVPFQHKEPLVPDVLPSGHRVNPTMKILIPVYAMGRMKSIWGEDSLEFKPERWISERGGKVKHEPSYKFMAFNAGPRTCLGKEVAFTQMRAVAANLIHNYRVQVVEGHVVVPNVSIILFMKHGLNVNIRKRWAA